MLNALCGVYMTEKELMLSIIEHKSCSFSTVSLQCACGFPFQPNTSCQESYPNVFNICLDRCNNTWSKRVSLICKYCLDNKIVTEDDLLEYLL